MEMWGVVFAFLVLVAFSFSFAIVAGLAGRRRGKGLIFGAAALLAPSLLASLVLGGCYSVQEIRSARGLKHFWFFEGVCPLPNDYELTFDAKFRTGYIAKRGSPRENAVVYSVSGLQVIFSFVAGKISTPGFGRESFFLLNTQDGTINHFETLAGLEASLGKAPILQEPSDFFEGER